MDAAELVSATRAPNNDAASSAVASDGISRVSGSINHTIFTFMQVSGL